MDGKIYHFKRDLKQGLGTLGGINLTVDSEKAQLGEELVFEVHTGRLRDGNSLDIVVPKAIRDDVAMSASALGGRVDFARRA